MSGDVAVSASSKHASSAAHDFSASLHARVHYLDGATHGSGVSLSVSNYDALLIGWAAQSLQSGVSVEFGSSKYTGGGAAEAATRA